LLRAVAAGRRCGPSLQASQTSHNRHVTASQEIARMRGELPGLSRMASTNGTTENTVFRNAEY